MMFINLHNRDHADMQILVNTDKIAYLHKSVSRGTVVVFGNNPEFYLYVDESPEEILAAVTGGQS
jgi:hypothetical protein